MITRLFLATLSLLAVNVASAGLMFDSDWQLDRYHGADDHNYGDRVGSSKFEVRWSRVEITDSSLTFTIATNFVDNPTELGARMGDLFFTFDGYMPFGTGPEYINDDASNGTVWTHGIHLNGVDGSSVANTGTAGLYDLRTATTYSDVIATSTEVWSASGLPGIIRDGQEVKVDTAAAGLQSVATTSANWDRTGSATIDGTTWSTLAMTVSLDVNSAFGISEGNDFEIAYKWGMTCANDTVENAAFYTAPDTSTVVPEPSTAAIFGLGLIGLAFVQRRRNLSRG